MKENKLDRVRFRLEIKAKEMKIIQCKVLGIFVITQIQLWWAVKSLLSRRVANEGYKLASA